MENLVTQNVMHANQCHMTSVGQGEQVGGQVGGGKGDRGTGVQGNGWGDRWGDKEDR